MGRTRHVPDLVTCRAQPECRLTPALGVVAFALASSRMKLPLLRALLFVPAVGFAECRTASDLKGFAVSANDKYRFAEDAISDHAYEINMDGESARVAPSDGLECTAASVNSVICVSSDQESSTTQT